MQWVAHVHARGPHLLAVDQPAGDPVAGLSNKPIRNKNNLNSFCFFNWAVLEV